MRTGGGGQLNFSARLLQLRPGLRGKPVYKAPQISPLPEQREVSRLQPGEVEQPLEQHVHVAGLAVGHVQILPLPLRGLGDPVPQALDVPLHTGEGGAQIVGNTGHQVGAGSLIGGAFLLLLQQVLLHPVERGAHRSKLVPPRVVDGLGKVAGLHPPGGPGQGVHRLEQLFQLIPGEQRVQQKDHHNSRPPAEEEGDRQRLRPGPGTGSDRRMGRGGDAHQLQLAHPPVQPDRPLLNRGFDLQRLEHLLRLTPVVPVDGVGGRAVHRQHGHQRHQNGNRIVKKEVPPDPHRVPLPVLQIYPYCNPKL